jgi:outer membrane protein TolC
MSQVVRWISLALCVPGLALGQVLSFESVWNQIAVSSKAQQASELMRKATDASKERAARHWLPRVYANARSYQTNDPAESFMGLLEQRAIQASDLTPDAINYPSSALYTKGTLGLELPLYEGGSKLAQVRMLGAATKVREFETQQITMDQYALVGNAYASIATLALWQSALSELQGEIQTLQKNYQLGSKDNPIGYSGFLGMKALEQRLATLSRQYQAEALAQRDMLQAFGLKQALWTTQKISAVEFVDRYFSGRKNLSKPSNRLQSLKHQADVSQQAINVEWGKLLPQIGAFAEVYEFAGNRDVNNGYTAGVYLKWNIFNPSDFGSVREATLKAQSARKLAEAGQEQELAEKARLQQAAQSLRANIHALQETEAVLKEQAQVTEQLFKKGTVTVLQFVDILVRRTDIMVQRIEAELQYLKLASEFAAKESLTLPSRISHA